MNIHIMNYPYHPQAYLKPFEEMTPEEKQEYLEEEKKWRKSSAKKFRKTRKVDVKEITRWADENPAYIS